MQKSADWQNKQIYAERIISIYKQAKTTAINSWATALIFLFVPNEGVSAIALYSWFAVLTLSCGLRLALAKRFEKLAAEVNDYERWGKLYAGTVFLTAVVWASGLFILVAPDNPQYQLFFMMVLVALCIGASHASTTYPLVGLAYNVPVMTCFVISCLLTGGTGFYVMALLGTIFAIMMVVVGRDNDQRFEEVQQLRFELAEKKEAAENANIAKSKFLAAASHDLRQPLHAITLFTGLLKEKDLGRDTNQVVNNIDSSIESLQELFNSLLDISKLDAGTINVNKAPVPLKDILEPIENDFRAEANSKHIELDIDIFNVWVNTDPILLTRIIRNLVANALQYTKEGSVTLRVEHFSGDTLRLQIKDTGIGIEADKQDEIFEEFVQLHNPERDRNKGLGLGLSIVKRLADLLDYPLSFNSQQGVGTSFSIDLPVVDAKIVNPINVEDHTIVSTLSLKDICVVVVDDEINVQVATRALLESWGCIVRCYESQAQALDDLSHTKLEDFQPDVILADYRLAKEQTGDQAIDAITALYPQDIVAMIITGDTAPDRLKDAEASGYILLHKPLKPVQLRSSLTRSLNKLRVNVA